MVSGQDLYPLKCEFGASSLIFVNQEMDFIVALGQDGDMKWINNIIIRLSDPGNPMNLSTFIILVFFLLELRLTFDSDGGHFLFGQCGRHDSPKETCNWYKQHHNQILWPLKPPYYINFYHTSPFPFGTTLDLLLKGGSHFRFDQYDQHDSPK